MSEFEQDIKAVEEVDKPDGIALELLKELKEQNKISDKHNVRLIWIIGILIAFITGISIFHEYQWSQFDKVVVDTQQGGNASYIGGDGDVNNYGEDSSTQEKVNKQEKSKGDTN